MLSVSVIIPTHNDAAYLTESVSSVLALEWPGDLEVLVIDDGSHPPVSDIFHPPNDSVVIHQVAKCGVSEARNIGMDRAQGDVLVFLDADDYMLPGRIESQVALFEQYPKIGLVAGDVTRRDTEGKELSWGIFEAFKDVDIPCQPLGDDNYLFDAEFADLLLTRPPCNTPVMAVRRSLVIGDGATRFHPGQICWEDWDFAIRLARRSRVGYVRRPITLYRKRSGSITASSDPRKFVSRAEMFERWLRDFADLAPEDRRVLRNARAESLITASWEYRATSRRQAIACAWKAIFCKPGGRTLKCFLGALGK